MNIADLEDERADLMDAINHLNTAIAALSEWNSDGLDTIINAKWALEERVAEINTKIAGMEPRERLTGWDI